MRRFGWLPFIMAIWLLPGVVAVCRGDVTVSSDDNTDSDDDTSQITSDIPVLDNGSLSAAVSVAMAAAKVTAQQTPVKRDCIAAVGPLLKASDGNLTPQVHEAYLNWSEHFVLHELQQSNITVPEGFLSEVQTNDTLRDAIFGAVFPPDPSILQNYIHLQQELGQALMEKYRSLVIAAAVAYRINGVEMGADPLEPASDALSAPVGRKAKKTAQETAQLVAAIADFLKTNQIAPLALYQNPWQQRQLAAYLQQRGIDPIPITQAPEYAHLGELLMQAMVILGERPAAHDPNPDVAAWLRYLVSVYKSVPLSIPTLKRGTAMSWPLFPIEQAPWPLLMPLSRPIPLKEANYIWEKFLGEYGPDRFHTYGPYRDPPEEIIYELQPSSWHWDSWPDCIVHGGRCGTMALIGNFVDDAVPLRESLRLGHGIGALFALFETSLKGFRLQPFAANEKPRENVLEGFVRDRMRANKIPDDRVIPDAAADALKSGNEAARDALSAEDRALAANNYRQIGNMNTNPNSNIVKGFQNARADWLEGKGPWPGANANAWAKANGIQ